MKSNNITIQNHGKEKSKQAIFNEIDQIFTKNRHRLYDSYCKTIHDILEAFKEDKASGLLEYALTKLLEDANAYWQIRDNKAAKQQAEEKYRNQKNNI